MESGSEKILAEMNKKTSIDLISNSLKTLASEGIKTTTYWVIGHPGETEEDFQDTLNFVEANAENIYDSFWHPVYYFPFGQVYSRLWNNRSQYRSIYLEKYERLVPLKRWALKSNPTREVVMERLERFRLLCKKLDIPSTYSILDMIKADKRWKDLHPNSVPPITDLANHKFLV